MKIFVCPVIGQEVISSLFDHDRLLAERTNMKTRSYRHDCMMLVSIFLICLFIHLVLYSMTPCDETMVLTMLGEVSTQVKLGGSLSPYFEDFALMTIKQAGICIRMQAGNLIA